MKRRQGKQTNLSAGNSDCPSVIVVMLRQPRLEQPTEMRSDPFWEYGSFGLTGCHQRNLMHPAKASLLDGARMAFVQGGALGTRLVYLSPPVKAIPYADRTEIRWSSGKPFQYNQAPLVVDTDGNSDMPAIKELIADVKRNGWGGKFASRFRSRREPLPGPIAEEMISVYEAMRKAGGKAVLATRYEQALPVNPPVIDRQRRKTYKQLLATAKAL